MPTLSKLLHPSLMIYTILALALTGHLLIGPVVAVPIAGGGGVGVSDGPMPGGMNLELRTVPFVRFGEAVSDLHLQRLCTIFRATFVVA